MFLTVSCRRLWVKCMLPNISLLRQKSVWYNFVANLQTALGQHIDSLEWMSDETKAKAHEKLNNFYVKIGYPDKWRDYTGLTVNPKDSYYANIRRAAEFETLYSLKDGVGKPVDKTKWYMSPQTVNAYYNPSSNEICFPARSISSLQ